MSDNKNAITQACVRCIYDLFNDIERETNAMIHEFISNHVYNSIIKDCDLALKDHGYIEIIKQHKKTLQKLLKRIKYNQ